MSKEPLSLSKIVFPTDFSETADEALAQAAEIASHFSSELIMVHLVPERRFGPDDLADMPGPDQLAKIFETEAKRRVTALDHVPNLHIRQVLRRDDVAPGINAVAEKEAADLIVMASHGHRGLRRLMLGSITEEVLRSSKTDVLTLRKREHGVSLSKLQSILVPIDFSRPSLAAVERAASLARATEASVVLMHVVEPSIYSGFYPPDVGVPITLDDRETLEVANRRTEELAETTAKAGIKVETIVETGHAASEIVEAATRMRNEIVMMASHGASGIERILLGSVTNQVLLTVNSPVWVVR